MRVWILGDKKKTTPYPHELAPIKIIGVTSSRTLCSGFKYCLYITDSFIN